MIPGSITEFIRYTPDEKRELYQTDPELFDKLAAEAVKQACIRENPEQTLRLQQMQLTIDALLQNSKNQLERMQTMENIFYSHVFGSNGSLSHLVDSWSELAHAVSEPEKAPAWEPTLFRVKI